MKKISILLIEDNQGDKILIETELKESKLFDTTISWIKSFTEFSTLNDLSVFDLILLDLTLPDEFGENLIIKVLDTTKFNIPVIILTGYDNVDLGLRSLDLGVDDYLHKGNMEIISLEKSILYGIQRHSFSQKLKDSELWFSTLFQKNPLPIILFDTKTKKIIGVNDAVVNKYGYEKEELLEMKISNLKASKKEIANSPLFNITNILPSKLYQGIFIHKSKHNNMIYLEISIKSVKINDKHFKILLANDITDKLEILTKINLQDKNLQEISWIQSHVLRAPVCRIMGIIDLLKSDEKLTNDEKNNFIGEIYNSTLELDKITKAITDKTKTE
jgi:PAS domain S-box-containing protein